jgi:hypothetical protein
MTATAPPAYSAVLATGFAIVLGLAITRFG